MIELTSEQKASIQAGKAVRVRENGREYVVLRPDVYERLAEESLDTGPWSIEEMDLLADEAEEMISRRESHAH